MLAAAVASAGLLAPALQEKMAQVDGREQIGVMIALAEQFDGAQVIRTIKNKQERWETTVNGLKSLATSTQAGLLSDLAAWEADGKVSDVQPLWIVNAVYCKATPAVIQAVSDRAEVWFVEWNLIPTENALAIAGAATAPADGTDNPEWNVQIVKADSVWHVYGYMGENVIVGHIDTGCDYTHPDLSGHMWTDPNYPNHGWDFENNDNDPMDAQGHGTHTAGTVASNGTSGDTCGMAPMAQIMSCRTKTSIGTPYPDTVAENTVMNSMQFCVAPPLSPANHAQLLTMSLGWYHSWNPRRGLWRECVTNVAAAGLPYFIANGNEGGGSPPDNVRTPGDCPGPWKHPAEPAGGQSGAISIGATDNADNLAYFSSIGPVSWTGVDTFNDYPYPPGLYKPDFSAPGVNVTSCLLGGGYTQMSGTSMATPCAAGVCALMLSKNPNLLPEDVDQIMQNSVLPRGGQPKNDSFGTGRIDAMLCIQNTPPAGPTHDVAMGAVLAPADKIDPLTPLAPVVVVKNRGTYHETSITFYCKVESAGTQVYSDQYVLALLDSAQTDTVTFPSWNVGPGSQTYDLTFWHAMIPDTNHHNDTCVKTTVTRGHDVSVAGMNIGGRVRANTPFTPRINLASTDYTETGFTAWCMIDSSGTVVYEDSTTIDSVPAGGSRTFSFPSDWNIGPVGAAYAVTMYHDCGPDQNRTNDTLTVNTTASDQARILMCYSDQGTPDALVAGLVAMGDSVTLLDVQSYTPTLSELQAYDAVGTQSNYQYADPTGFGNVLADYVDAGGGVVIGQFSFSSGWEMGGRIMGGAYATISVGSNTMNATTLGWNDPAHPIMSGVSTVGEYYAGNGAFVGESVAVWQDGRRYVGVSSNQKVVGLNQYPGNYDYPQRNGDWVLVWHNSFMYVAGSVSGVGGFDPFAPVLHVTLSATPNPVLGPRAEVNYTVPDAGKVSLNVFDLNGRLVKTLVSGNAKPGVNRVVWNLTNNAGKQVSSGVYFCKLVAGSKTQSRKLVVR
jgi:hypothetical protein